MPKILKKEAGWYSGKKCGKLYFKIDIIDSLVVVLQLFQIPALHYFGLCESEIPTFISSYFQSVMLTLWRFYICVQRLRCTCWLYSCLCYSFLLFKIHLFIYTSLIAYFLIISCILLLGLLSSILIFHIFFQYLIYLLILGQIDRQSTLRILNIWISFML